MDEGLRKSPIWKPSPCGHWELLICARTSAEDAAGRGARWIRGSCCRVPERVGDQWAACLSLPPNLCHRMLPVDARERLLLTACSNKVAGRETGRQVLEFISGKAGVCLLESE